MEDFDDQARTVEFMCQCLEKHRNSRKLGRLMKLEKPTTIVRFQSALQKQISRYHRRPGHIPTPHTRRLPGSLAAFDVPPVPPLSKPDSSTRSAGRPFEPYRYHRIIIGSGAQPTHSRAATRKMRCYTTPISSRAGKRNRGRPRTARGAARGTGPGQATEPANQNPTQIRSSNGHHGIGGPDARGNHNG